MTNSPETPSKKPKMAQGRKSGPPPEENIQEKLNQFLRESKKLQKKKIKEILDQNKQEH